jgi:CDP-6-deoxy-D-xylo-4-hexulose-3-dehydrase
MGLAQLKKLPTITQKRNHNHKRLSDIFAKYEEFFILPKATEHANPSWFAFALTIKDGAPFKRKDIVNHFEDNKIQTRPYFAGNVMLQPAYAGIMNQDDVIKNFPNARKVTTDTFFLGTSPVITDEQLDYIEMIANNFLMEFKL